jgi:hypothetical protein
VRSEPIVCTPRRTRSAGDLLVIGNKKIPRPRPAIVTVALQRLFDSASMLKILIQGSDSSN